MMRLLLEIIQLLRKDTIDVELLKSLTHNFVDVLTGEKEEDRGLTPRARLTRIKERGGFGSNCLTPYVHMLIDHLPDQVARLGSLKGKSTQSLELQNGIDRRIFYTATTRRRKSTNVETLQHSLRLEINTEAFVEEKVKCNFCGKEFDCDGAWLQSHLHSLH
jgi:hypothetical protein